MTTSTKPGVAELVREAGQHMESGRAAEAEAVCGQILAMDPGNFDAHQMAGEICIHLERHGDAVEHYAACIRARPGDPWLYYNQGVAYDALTDMEGAINAYRNVVRIDPTIGEAHYNLGNSLDDAGRTDDALEAYREAARQGLNHGPNHLHMGDIYWAKGRFDDALAQAKIAMRLEPDNPLNHHLHGMVLTAQGQLKEAADALMEPVRRRRSVTGEITPGQPGFNKVNATKLRHDIAQLRYLADLGELSAEFDGLADDYEKVLVSLPDEEMHQTAALSPRPPDAFLKTYNRLIHYAPAPAMPEGAIHPDLDTDAISDAFLADPIGFAWFEDFLKPEALKAVYEFFLKSTIWYDITAPGEVGAGMRYGICCPLVLQIANELRAAFPRVFRDYHFKNAWSYQFYKSISGMATHADDGMVSINFWLTPDEANLNKETGGLEFWNKTVPLDYWRTRDQAKKARIMDALKAEPDARSQTLPYRCNRATLFNSNIVHRTDELDFRKGYGNQRMNLTILFGQPGSRG